MVLRTLKAIKQCKKTVFDREIVWKTLEEFSNKKPFSSLNTNPKENNPDQKEFDKTIKKMYSHYTTFHFM
jgi:hypothetical protein